MTMQASIALSQRPLERQEDGAIRLSGNAGGKGKGTGKVSSRALAYRLLQLTRCSACMQPVGEPVTLPCGHSSCLSCIIGHANSSLDNLSSLPSSSSLPPRFPLCSTTVPCPMSGCSRGAIGRGVGVWDGFRAIYGDKVDEEAFASLRTPTNDPPPIGMGLGQPLDGFIIPTNANSSGLGLVSAQSRSSFASKYAISKFSMQGNDIGKESALLRTDVILSKTVDVLQKYSGFTRQKLSARHGRGAMYGGRRTRLNARHRRRSAAPRMLTEPTGTRTEINERFLAVMGASEEGIDSCTVGGVSAVADDSSGEEDEFIPFDEGDVREGDGPSEYDDDDEEIGGAFARTYDVAVRPSTKRARRYTLQRQSTLSSSSEAHQEATLAELYLLDGTLEEEQTAIDAIHSELSDILECQLCYMPLYQPLTTPCGHTFCSRCFARSLDHSTTCPLCRADMPAFSFFQEHPCNEAILKILTAEIRPASISNEKPAEGGEAGFVQADDLDDSSNVWGLANVYQERKLALEREERESLLSTPLFVCTLGFPQMPTILHIFEPRYRLMIRRCLESGHPRFGMVLHSQDMSGPTPGMSPYGTMLEIKTVKMLPDGRSMIETVGSHRFKVLEKGSLDGYTVGRIVPIDDVPSHAEGEIEQASMGIFDLWEDSDNSPLSSSPVRGDSTGSGDTHNRPESENDDSNAASSSSSSSGIVRPFLTKEEAKEAHRAFQSALGLDSLQREVNGRPPSQQATEAEETPQIVNVSPSTVQRSTMELIEKCTAFIETLRSGSAPWLITRLNDTYGPMPEPLDVAAFGYWMALVMPIDENEKAKLLPVRSARLRLCIVVHWIEQLRQMWWFNNGCSVQ